MTSWSHDHWVPGATVGCSRFFFAWPLRPSRPNPSLCCWSTTAYFTSWPTLAYVAANLWPYSLAPPGESFAMASQRSAHATCYTPRYWVTDVTSNRMCRHHRLRGSASPVVKVTSHFNGKLQNLTPRISVSYTHLTLPTKRIV